MLINYRVHVVALVLWPLLAGCGRDAAEPVPEPARPVKLAEVSGTTPSITFSADGRVEAVQRAELSFERGDIVTEIPVKPGDAVKSGDVLARIDTGNLEIDAIAKRARAEEALLQRDRMARLFEREAIARVDLDRARSTYDGALADLLRVEKDMHDSALRAPFAGVVAATRVDAFQTVQAKQPVIVLHDLSRYQIRIDLPETFILRVGQTTNSSIQARFDHLPGAAFPLNIKEYATEANPDTLTYPAVFTMDPPKGEAILPGMSVRLDLTVFEEAVDGRNCWVPEAAIFSDDAKLLSVWRIDAATMTTERRAVVIGEVRDGFAQIKDGLNVGDIVAVSGIHQLLEGQPVKAYSKPGRN